MTVSERFTQAFFGMAFSGWLVGAIGYAMFGILTDGFGPQPTPDYIIWTLVGGLGLCAVGAVALILQFIAFLFRRAITGGG